MKILKIKITKKNKKFLGRYHAGDLKVESWDEIGTMAFGILGTTYDREKYTKYRYEDFCKIFMLCETIELVISDDKFLGLRKLYLQEKVGIVQKRVNVCTIKWGSYRKPKEHIIIKYVVCREACVSFNSYVDKLLNRVFLAYMKYEVLHLDKKIVDAIHAFQVMYDLSDDEYSTETCKRYWQRHKNDAMTPFPLRM